MGAEVPTDRQLQRLAAAVVQLCLEVERGLRAADQLYGLIPPPQLHAWLPARHRFPGGPVTPRDIGPVRLTRLSDRRAMVTVATRTDTARFGALTFSLQGRNGRWMVTELVRLQPGAHYYRSSKQPSRPKTPQERIRHVQIDRRYAVAAWVAASKRVEDAAHSDPAHHHARDAVDRWRQIVAALDRELAALARHATTTTVGRAR